MSKEPIIYHGDGESGQRRWVRERQAEREARPPGDREAAIEARTLLRDLQGCTSKEEYVEMLAAALTAARAEEREKRDVAMTAAKRFQEWYKREKSRVKELEGAAREILAGVGSVSGDLQETITIISHRRIISGVRDLAALLAKGAEGG